MEFILESINGTYKSIDNLFPDVSFYTFNGLFYVIHSPEVEDRITMLMFVTWHESTDYEFEHPIKSCIIKTFDRIDINELKG